MLRSLTVISIEYCHKAGHSNGYFVKLLFIPFPTHAPSQALASFFFFLFLSVYGTISISTHTRTRTHARARAFSFLLKIRHSLVWKKGSLRSDLNSISRGSLPFFLPEEPFIPYPVAFATEIIYSVMCLPFGTCKMMNTFRERTKGSLGPKEALGGLGRWR